MKRLALALAFGFVAACDRTTPSPETKARENDAAAMATAPAAPACTPRSAEKLGFPFLRICPPGEAGFWINAAPMGCSAGDHDSIRCPLVTAVAHPARQPGAAIPSSAAAVIDAETAARLCYFRMGGHLASRAERAKARAAAGLVTVLVTESESAAGRFGFDELPEWVFEESGASCENALPSESCHTGLYPSTARSAAVPWTAVRACEATFGARRPDGLSLVALGERCPSPPLALDGGALATVPCALRSAATDPNGIPSPAAFTFACRRPAPSAHPEGVAPDVAAYRCVIPENALGTFDVPGR